MRGPAVNRLLRAAASALLLTTGSAIASCDLLSGDANTGRAILAALEPDLARPGPVSLGPEAGELLAWLQSPDDPAASDAALREVARRYGLQVSEDENGRPTLADGWEADARPEITAIGLAVVDPDASDEIIAAGVYWATPVLERLRIVPVPDGARAARVRDVAPTLADAASTCAVRVEEWVRLTPDLASDLLAASSGLWMLAFGPGTGSDDPSWSTWIASEEIRSAIGYAHPGVPSDPPRSYSALFYGRGPSLLWTLRNAPRASATLGPGDLAGWIRSLFR